MLKLTILTIGKTKEQWLQTALAEYEKRLAPHCQITWNIVKNDQKLEETLTKASHIVCLDPNGRQHTSRGFSQFVYELPRQSTFVIGGPEGIPDRLITNPLSFSRLTLTHQLCRLMLLEQLYRAVQIKNNTPYDK